jgi:hypothetical protein
MRTNARASFKTQGPGRLPATQPGRDPAQDHPDFKTQGPVRLLATPDSDTSGFLHRVSKRKDMLSPCYFSSAMRLCRRSIVFQNSRNTLSPCYSMSAQRAVRPALFQNAGDMHCPNAGIVSKPKGYAPPCYCTPTVYDLWHNRVSRLKG